MIVHFISFLILDLPKLHTISFNSNVLEGDDNGDVRTYWNSHESYNNMLIMKSKVDLIHYVKHVVMVM